MNVVAAVVVTGNFEKDNYHKLLISTSTI